MDKRVFLKRVTFILTQVCMLAIVNEHSFSQFNKNVELPLNPSFPTITKNIFSLNDSATSIIVVAKGWNLISLPLTVQDGRKSVLFPTAKSEAFAHNGGYVKHDTLQYGVGYWLKFVAPETITIAGSYRDLDTVALKRGWNMIGSMHAPFPSHGYMNSDPPGIIASEFFGYRRDSGYTMATVLETGKGYWVNASQPGKLARYCVVDDFPRVEFLPDRGSKPNPADTLYVLKETTYTWRGIKFSYRGKDLNSRQLWYSWRVDSVKWSGWDTSKTAAVTGSDMDPSRPYTGIHTFEVRAKNEFGKITPTDSMPRAQFVTIYPSFAEPGYPRRVLLVIASKLNAAPPPHKPWQPGTDEDSIYYKEIFDALGFIYNGSSNTGKDYDIWNTETKPIQGNSQRSHPSLSTLSRYTTVYLISDIGPLVLPSYNNKMMIPSTLYSKYLDAGGNMIWSGIFYPIVFQVVDDPVPLFSRFQLLSAQFPDYITITRTNSADFIGAFGSLGYPSYVELDSSKLDTNKNRWNGGLPLVAISSPTGFGEIIFRYDSRNDSIYQDVNVTVPIEKHSIGYIYRGITYKTAYLGIPLWFVKKDQAIEILRQTFELFYP